MKFLLIIGEEP